MPSTESGPITGVLRDAARGDPGAASRLLHLVYGELKRLAAARLSKLPPGGTLQPTALVHDAYLRVMGKGAPEYENRKHFFFAAARAMRDLIAEQERRRGRLKRDGGRRVTLNTGDLVVNPRPEALLDLDVAIGRLEARHPSWAEVVLLKFYTGLSSEETAEVIGVSLRTVERRWTGARAWLRRELSRGVREQSAS